MKFNQNLSVFILLLFTGQSCQVFREQADLIVFNAKVCTLDSLNPSAECIAVRDGKILAVGKDSEIRSRYKAVRSLDAGKSYVYPGFIDAHSHFTGFALDQRYALLNDANSFGEVIDRVREFHAKNPGSWIVGRGWDQNRWAGQKFPDRSRLDELFPDVPVILTRVDGHAVLANEAAIRAAGLKAPFDARETLFENGKPTGVFLEKTADRLKNAIPLPSGAELVKLLEKATELCHAAGLTAVTDAGLDKSSILLIDSLQKAGLLQIRIDAMMNPDKATMDHFLPSGVYQTGFLRLGSVKVYADGALGSRGACLLQPYADDPTNYGILVTSADQLREICKLAFAHGFQVNTHAIGDSAVRTVLRVYAEFLMSKNDLRWRIEHAQVVNENDFDSFGRCSVIPSVQATHATSDMDWVGKRLGENRLRNAYAYHRLMAENGWIPNGTDFPVENISPLLTFYAATVRKHPDGKPENGFQTENALSRADALKSITLWAAKASFRDKQLGSIETGKFADFVILNADLMKVPDKDIPSVRVKYTFVNGRIVFENKPEK